MTGRARWTDGPDRLVRLAAGHAVPGQSTNRYATEVNGRSVPREGGSPRCLADSVDLPTNPTFFLRIQVLLNLGCLLLGHGLDVLSRLLWSDAGGVG